jgi:hypothetical protein
MMEQFFCCSTATMSTETKPNNTMKTNFGIYYVQRSGLCVRGGVNELSAENL